MSYKSLFLALFIAILSSLTAGCKLGLIAVEGGDIQSESGTYVCQSGMNCVVEISDTTFNEKFEAIPAEGFEFVKWIDGPSFLCGGSTNAVCTVNNVALAGNALAEAIVASDSYFYILPEFRAVPAPDPDPQPTLTTVQFMKYNNSCVQCHVSGAAGAPRANVPEEWEPRLTKGLDTLVMSVKQGLGIMPAGGRCANCSDDDYRDMILYMASPG